MDTLSAAHIPITNEGHSNGYSFIGRFSMYPLDWTDEEAVAFMMLPKLLDQYKHLVPSEFYSAYSKVMATYHKEQNMKKNVVDQLIEAIQMGTPAVQTESSQLLSPVINAIIERKTIDVVYHTQSRNVTTKRLIDPYYLIPRQHQFYLIAYCHEKERILTFRMSRFQQVTILDQTFKKSNFDLREFFKHTWSIIQGKQRIRFKVHFSAEVARYIKEEELFVKPKLTEQVDGSLLFEVTLNDDFEFLQWIRQYGPNAEILEPKEYRKKMREELARWMKVYE